MSEKFCYQVAYPELTTPCFRKAGSIPCESAGCPVDDRKAQIENEGDVVSLDLLALMLHSRCRMSSLSEDNKEFLQRVEIMDQSREERVVATEF